MKYPSGDVGHPVMYKNLKFRREYGLEMLIRVCQHTDDIQNHRTGGIDMIASI